LQDRPRILRSLSIEATSYVSQTSHEQTHIKLHTPKGDAAVAVTSTIVSFVGLFCKRDLCFSSHEQTHTNRHTPKGDAAMAVTSTSHKKTHTKRDHILQKRPRILRSLLIVATPYTSQKKKNTKRARGNGSQADSSPKNTHEKTHTKRHAHEKNPSMRVAQIQGGEDA